MKKTNFTFSGTSMKWLLKSIVPVLFFMTLSLGAEAQASMQDAVVTNAGVNIVNKQVAAQRLEAHITSLEAITPTTEQEEVMHSIRLDYAKHVAGGLNISGDFAYHVVNSQTYLEDRVGDFSPQYRPSAQTIYNEMVTLLQ